MSNPLSRFIALFFPSEKPNPNFVVDVFSRDDGEWQCVAMGFPNAQAGVDYAKEKYTVAWQLDRVRVRSLH